MLNDPLIGTAWSHARTVEGFARSTPNATLLDYAQRISRGRSLRIADIGCGAGRNTVPLADAGATVIATDLSLPMVEALSARAGARRIAVLLAPMDALPIRDRSVDLVVAHGIWNLARSDAEFRRGICEAARIAARGARLFVFMFSRNTLSPSAHPVAGERFVFTEFSGSPQVFVTREQLVHEVGAAGFEPDPMLPLLEHNLPPPGQPRFGGAPVIYEAGFIFTGA